MITARLFYDGACPMCSKEINFLRRNADADITFIDISSINKEAGIPSYDELMRILHYQDCQGNWHLGLDATLGAWRHTPYSGFIVWMRWPIIRNIADAVYNVWAEKRRCKQGVCSTK